MINVWQWFAAKQISIDVPLDVMKNTLEIYNERNQTNFYISDPDLFLKEIIIELTYEDDEGTNIIHRMLDKALLKVIESGGFGLEGTF